MRYVLLLLALLTSVSCAPRFPAKYQADSARSEQQLQRWRDRYTRRLNHERQLRYVPFRPH